MEHRRTLTYALLAAAAGLALVLCSAVAHGRFNPIFVFPFALIGAGALGNGVDSFDGTVANPFLYHLRGSQYVGFNLADLALATGGVWLVATASVLVVPRLSASLHVQHSPVGT
jgi:lipoprotein signal peptidase